jgi:hypothetical protein
MLNLRIFFKNPCRKPRQNTPDRRKRKAKKEQGPPGQKKLSGKSVVSNGCGIRN